MRIDPIDAALLVLAALFILVIFPAGCESARDLADYRAAREGLSIMEGGR